MLGSIWPRRKSRMTYLFSYLNLMLLVVQSKYENRRHAGKSI
jgi:hypothetical protein